MPERAGPMKARRGVLWLVFLGPAVALFALLSRRHAVAAMLGLTAWLSVALWASGSLAVAVFAAFVLLTITVAGAVA